MGWFWTGDSGVAETLPAGQLAFLNGGLEAMLWGRTYPITAAAGRSIAAEFMATAQAAVAAGRVGDRTVTATGDGLLAQLVRKILLADWGDGSEVVIETTGSPDEIRRAVTTLPRLGTLVLAGPPGVAELDLATYRDLHVRALTVVGVPWVSDPPSGLVGFNAIDEALSLLKQNGSWYALPNELI